MGFFLNQLGLLSRISSDCWIGIGLDSWNSGEYEERQIDIKNVFLFYRFITENHQLELVIQPSTVVLSSNSENWNGQANLNPHSIINLIYHNHHNLISQLWQRPVNGYSCITL
ncbi:unnamed protein product [Rhizophagus irregularis]|nr:unnamed protein product [Rhizophagus irregularis]